MTKTPEEIAAKRMRRASFPDRFIANMNRFILSGLEPPDGGVHGRLRGVELATEKKLAAIARDYEIVAQRLPPRVRAGVLRYLDSAKHAAEQELAAARQEAQTYYQALQQLRESRE